MGYTPSSGLIATHSLFLTVAATASPMLSQTCSESLQGIPVLGIQHVDLKSLCIDQIVRVLLYVPRHQSDLSETRRMGQAQLQGEVRRLDVIPVVVAFSTLVIESGLLDKFALVQPRQNFLSP